MTRRGWTSRDLPVVCDDENLWTVTDAATALGAPPGDPEGIPFTATVAKLRDLARYHHLTPVGKRRSTSTGKSGRYARVYLAIEFIELYEKLSNRHTNAA